MSLSVLCGGEDVGAVIFDVGSYTFRAGFSQEDRPKLDMPVLVGISGHKKPAPATKNIVTPNGPSDTRVFEAMETEESDSTKTKLTSKENQKKVIPQDIKYHVDTPALCGLKSDMEITNCMKDSMINDWDLFEKLLDFTYAKCVCSSSKQHPVLMTEAAWNIPSKRTKLTELLFEKYEIPAFYLINNAQTAAFANSRTTVALVVDSGSSHTSVVPIFDGHVLTQGVVRIPLGGDFINDQCAQMLEQKGIDVIPTYMIGGKERVKSGEKPIWKMRKNLPDVTENWKEYMKRRVIRDFQETVLEVPVSHYDAKKTAGYSSVHYEFPNGYHQDFGHERFRIPDLLFDPPSKDGKQPFGIIELIELSVSSCDFDTRSGLYDNLIITGGNSLIKGFGSRLANDLVTRKLRNKLKLISSSDRLDRRFGPWVGASILASSGTFQQLWISRKEYEEYGSDIVQRKCP